MQIAPDISFQSKADDKNNDQQMSRAKTLAIERMLWGNKSQNQNGNSGPQSTSPYVVGYEDINQDWESEQLAWHLLGFYIDCDSQEEDHHEEDHRRLYSDTKKVCKRKVMYAVYVDPNYQGGGLGEYKYYNKNTGTYYCYNGGYCRAQMDCHSTDTTTWQLVGIFKIDRLSEGDGWMEQLFKHAGVCYWGWDNYEIAANMRKSLPTKCQKTAYKFNGMYLYSDVKPIQDAGISMGLYTDESCSQLYEKGEGTKYDPFVDTDLTESDFNTFNTLLDDYKICQPCIAYDLTQYDFSCADDAGYTSCNQCMKFAIKAEASIATPREIQLASIQQSLMPLGDSLSDDGTSSFFAAQEVDSLSIVTHELSFVLVKVSAAFLLVCLLIFSYKPKRLNPRNITFPLKRRKREGKKETLMSPSTPTPLAMSPEIAKTGKPASVVSAVKTLNPRNIKFLFGRKKEVLTSSLQTGSLDAFYSTEHLYGDLD